MRHRLIAVLAAALCLLLVHPAMAPGATEAQLRQQLERLKKETSAAGQAYSDAHWKLDEADVRIDRLDKRIDKTSKKLKAAKKRLNAHASAMYRREDLDTLSFLLGADGFEEFVTRLELLSRIGSTDAQVIVEVRNLRNELRAEREQIAAEREVRAKRVARLRKERDRLQGRLRDKEAEFKALRDKLDAARGGRGGGVAAAPGPNGMVFPVVGSYYYSDTWGASRSGGRRRHQGTDIMARNGTPVVAILSGTVRTRNGGLGGKTIWLTASNGWQFYYAHLDSYVVTSGRVKAGQVIGRVGSTGNASSSSPHLHLQIHPGGGSPVNPYPYLRKME